MKKSGRFARSFFPSPKFLVALVGDDSQNVVGAKDDVVLAVDLNFRSAVLAVQNEVAWVDADRSQSATVESLARPNGQNFAALRLLLGRIGKQNAACGHLFLFGGLNNDAIVQRLDAHFYLV